MATNEALQYKDTSEDIGEPPPLEDMSNLLCCLKLQKQLQVERRGSTSLIEDKTSLLDSSLCQNKRLLLEDASSCPADTGTKQNVSNSLRKGFLNCKHQNKEPNSRDHKKKSDIPLVKPSRKQTTSIPEFLKVESPIEQCRKELQSLLKPTEKIVNEVMGNDDIKQGLEDPEIMAAVQEIANDSSKIQKYKNHPKVVKFYSHLGKLMSDKIEKQNLSEKD